jgi:molybdopterin molybdotransferase
MIAYKEALSRTLESIGSLSHETLDLIEATGRIAYKDVHSVVAAPSADVSLKDGYAVHSEDVAAASTSKPIFLRIVGEIAAGGSWDGLLKSGEAVRILSGARIPSGADAVLAVEFTSYDGSSLAAKGNAEPGRNILPFGTDLQNNDLLISTGMTLGPGLVGLLAAGGHHEVKVYKQPRVGILATGDEVIAPGGPLRAGQLYASNLVTLAAWCTKFGWPAESRIVPDDELSIRSGLEEFLSSCDVLLTSGGAWKGSRDLVVDILDEMGWKKVYHRVKIGPGKAVGFGLYSGKPVFCLPGGPPSNLMAFLQLALPGIQKVAGWMEMGLRERSATLQTDLSGQIDWTPFIFGQLEQTDDIPFFAPLRIKSRLSEMAIATAIALIPEGISKISRGSQIHVQLLSQSA